MLFFLKGCGSVDGWFLKKYLILLFLSKLCRDSVKLFCGGVLLGTKVRPSERTSSCVVVRVLDERLVMYFSLFSVVWISFFMDSFSGFFVFGAM